MMEKIPPHVERMVNEFAELTKRLEKLGEFMESNPQFKELSSMDQELLKAQGHAMMAYANILNLRIGLTGVDRVLPTIMTEDEPVEVGEHDIDRDGPPSFSG